MSHYEQRLQRDIDEIRDRVRQVMERVERAVTDSVHALLSGNKPLANLTILGDGAINRETRAIDKLCNSFIVRHLPSGEPLRMMSAIMRSNIELERIGDYAVNISREAIQLPQPPVSQFARTIELMAEQSGQMLHEAGVALIAGNAEQARAVMSMASQVDQTLALALAELKASDGALSADQLIALFVVYSMLERVSDQAKNLCEEAVFAATGETKRPKVYGVLFVDRDNSVLGPMAEAIAKRLFPNSGRYTSAGSAPTSKRDRNTARFLQSHGYELEDSTQTLERDPHALRDYHVIVSLQGPVSDHVAEVPFHTIALQWDICATRDDLDDADLAECYRRLQLEVRDLMVALRGEAAD